MSFSKQQQQEFFEAIYKQLNPKQQEAVNQLEGPVMVIAGPGTGKTQILAARIGKILLETDAGPQNILCLTYTDAGVVAMRKRLQQFIGADAYKVGIYTFHAFCNEVIQDNLSFFEKPALDPISDLEKASFFKELIDGFDKHHPLKRYSGDAYYESVRLSALFSTMKREGWTPAYLDEMIQNHIRDMATDDQYLYQKAIKGKKKGDLKPDYYTDLDRMEKLRAAVGEFDRYQQLMYAHHRYDFDDMINWVIRAFEQHPNLLADYQERYQYILIDEFQDTSGSQNQIIQLLISYWDQPNVFVVGDDDQSIYRFQGANLENMLEFAQQYVSDLKTVVLTDNYRSIQPILDYSRTLISKNEERLIRKIPGLSKDLRSANKEINTLKIPPRLLRYNSMKEEMIGITLQVEALLASGIAPGKIAVIYRENRYGEELADYFGIRKIPFFSKRSLNLLDQPFIRKILKLMEYLDAELDIPYSGDELLFEILHFDFYKNPPITIAKLTVETNQRRYKDKTASLRLLLQEKANGPAADLFDPGLPESMRYCAAMLEDLIAAVPNTTIQQLMDLLIRNAGILPYIMNSPLKVELMQQLTGFYDFIKEENRRNPTLDLTRLMEMLRLMKKENIVLPLIRVNGSDTGVNLLTAHGSKGLEFDYVFMAGTHASVWEKKRKYNPGYKLPPNVFTSGAQAKDTEELRRLFYVAMTRAERYLTMSFAQTDGAGKQLENSMFIAEIQEQHTLEIQNEQLDDETILAFQELTFSGERPVIGMLEADFVDSLLSRFEMNVTALNNYLACPLQFYYQNLLRIPSAKNEALAFGSAVHFALEKLFTRMQQDPQQQFPPVDLVLGDFNWSMQRNRECFTRESYERRMEQGSIIIPDYYRKYVSSWHKIVKTEIMVHSVIDGVPLKGKVDKLEFHGKEVNVVDYKTGSYKKASPKLKGPDQKQPDGGDYWRQAVFYKLLIDHFDRKDWKVTSAAFDFIEPDEKNEFKKSSIVIGPADLTTVKQQIVTVWNKIQSKDFYTGCGKEDCGWCNFVKNNYLYTGLLAPEESLESDLS
ncbi:ATP-dependent DNA helicase [Niabella terrae]